MRGSISALLAIAVVWALGATALPASAAGFPDLEITAPTTAIAATAFDVTVLLTTDNEPIVDAEISVLAQRPGQSDVVAPGTTNGEGLVTVSVVLPVRGEWTINATYVDGASNTYSAEPASVLVGGQQLDVVVTAATSVTSESAFPVRIVVTRVVDGTPAVGIVVDVSRPASSVQPAALLATKTTDSHGVINMVASLWRSSGIVAVSRASEVFDSARSTRINVTARPAFGVVSLPAGAPKPLTQFNDAPAAKGGGANAVVTTIPDAVWASMQGLTWHKGCLARSSLRYITVNYIGFDGFRYRGSIIMATKVAAATATVFTRLYALRYPIRSMFLVDRFGKAPSGYPGANDYASMASGNTSGFNCRYIVGKESVRAMSPHAYGVAVDLNTWENPYYSRLGPLPNSWWMPRTRRSVAVLTLNSPAVKAFRAAGFTWGGSYKDYQHFQR